jgi:hypothetical protein
MLTGVAIVASLVVATPGSPSRLDSCGRDTQGLREGRLGPVGNTHNVGQRSRCDGVVGRCALPNTTPVAGYTVRRFNSATGVPQTVLASCTGTIATLTCTEFGVAPGTWKYAVTPKQALWTGPESAQSATATVGSPSLALTTTTTSVLPASSGGSIANFLDGETVTYHLDGAGRTLLPDHRRRPHRRRLRGRRRHDPRRDLARAHSVFAVGSLGSTASAASRSSITPHPS